MAVFDRDSDGKIDFEGTMTSTTMDYDRDAIFEAMLQLVQNEQENGYEGAYEGEEEE
ncbi:hypothetical protein H0H92_003258 [Tricholoma furcatifolium]|nr:hypothetical protein H0H92_003258 [Tricholoma furcatifolium]